MVHESGSPQTAVLGIVVALQREAKSLTKKSIPLRTPVKIAEQVVLIVSGMGPQQARAAAQILVQQGATALLSWGTAAALDPDLRSGTLFIPDTIIDSEGHTYSTDTQWKARLVTELSHSLRLANGNLITSFRIISTPQDKHELFKRHKCPALDMESAALAAVAQAESIPFLAIRAIVDTADMVLPNSVISALDNDGKPDIVKLISGLLFQPQDWRALIRLTRSFHAAEKSLSSTIHKLGINLAMPESPNTFTTTQ